MINRKKILAVFSVFILVIAGVVVFNYLSSYKKVVIKGENIKSISIYSGKKLDSGNDDKPMIENAQLDHPYKLKQGDYVVFYEGVDGYDSRYVDFKLSESKQVVELKPSLTDEKLEELLKQERPSVVKSLDEKYKKINQYTIQIGKLYKNGEWYGTTLINKSKYSPNRDTLRVVLHKEDGKWTVATDPPYIYLSKFSYPNVPEDVLSDVNSLSVPDLRLNSPGTLLR